MFNRINCNATLHTTVLYHVWLERNAHICKGSSLPLISSGICFCGFFLISVLVSFCFLFTFLFSSFGGYLLFSHVSCSHFYEVPSIKRKISFFLLSNVEFLLCNFYFFAKLLPVWRVHLENYVHSIYKSWYLLQISP